ncbi:esterase family protein [Corynebacterium sp. TAE3-ERU12]|uniref:alpha/beta hydrolase n=1 Tax=Corynebacterium sp. TAE3-ERU12 TaxID=2849491 RepID=UPI001C492111|nr:alpha/beta hydrolase family protein [Corynebacterium sp. TAE3-ERU12]MBV7294508.1 esterase family protein [Corynebacterium sp. TAE3-ERU12]
MRFRHPRLTAAVAAAAATMLLPVTAGASSLPNPELTEGLNSPEVPATAHTVQTREAKVGYDPEREVPGAELLEGRDNVTQLWAHSPSMQRNIPIIWSHPAGAEPTAPRPTLYVLNGADGGKGRATWIAQTDILDFFQDKDVNVVIVQDGAYSYYTDWVNQDTDLGRQYWETFLTRELPGPLENLIGADGQKRGIVGMSMSATSVLNFAAHDNSTYDAVGSFSGCAATSDPASASFIELVVNRGGASGRDMWGQWPNELWKANDSLINAGALAGVPSFISNGSGLWGEWDTTANPNIDSEVSLIAQRSLGSAIEAATNQCTHDLKVRMDSLGASDNVIWDFNNVGTHSWGYWQDDLHQSWDQLFSRELY